MPLDETAAAFLEAMGTLPQPYEVDIAEFRRIGEELIKPGDPIPVGDYRAEEIPGGDGQPLPIRVYIPEGAADAPVVVWTHGGSFVRGSLDMVDASRRAFVNATGFVVVGVGQRLSPEATFPQPVRDGLAALTWAREHAAEIAGNPDRVGVGGESSGGNLAAAVTLLATQETGRAPAFQILVEPLLDASCSRPSVRELAEGYVLTREQLLWAYEQYAPGVDRGDPLISPLLAAGAGTPPTVVVTVEFDPVRDEGEEYVERLRQAGVPVWHQRLDGFVHHFPGPRAGVALARLVGELKAKLEAPPARPARPPFFVFGDS